MINNVECRRNFGVSSSVEQRLKLRVQLFKVSKEMRAEEPAEQAGANVTRVEDLSMNNHFMKELGSHLQEINYADYKYVQEKIDVHRKWHLIYDCNLNADCNTDVDYNSADYEYCLRQLADVTRSSLKIKRTHLKYPELCEYYTVKQLGAGNFGKAFLVIKADETAMFEREMNIDTAKLFKGKRNLYVMKHVQFPEDNIEHRAQILEVLQSTVKTETHLGRVLYHPNISEFYGAYFENHFCTLVQEYLCCGPFRSIVNDEDLFASNKLLYKKRLLFYSSQVILALEYLHENKIYHHDLKDDNVILDYKGYAKLIDFGISVIGTEPNIRAYAIETIVNFHMSFEDSCTDDEKYAYYLKYLDHLRDEHLYEVDLFCLVTFHRLLVDQYFENGENDSDIDLAVKTCLVCSGIVPTVPVPTASECRSQAYFESINFTKMLLRGYDLQAELELDLEGLFEKYSKESEWSLSNNNRGVIFSDDNRWTFQRKNKLAFLKAKYIRHYKAFIKNEPF